MPAWWAKRWLRDADFYFHEADLSRSEFDSVGLRTNTYRTPEEILIIAGRSKRVITTDSFPSHVLQIAGDNVCVLLTQQPQCRIIHPGFRGVVVDPVMPCSPCFNISRKLKKGCASGFSECQSWKSGGYAQGKLEEFLTGRG